MKNRAATLLAIGGVLAAGSVAGLVNASALNGTNSEVAAPVPALDGAVTTTLVTGQTEGPAPTAITRQIVEIGGAGSITVDVVGASLRLVAIQPAAGWQIGGADTADESTVTVVFVSPTGLTRSTTLSARDNIVSAVSIESAAPSTTDTQPPTNTPLPDTTLPGGTETTRPSPTPPATSGAAPPTTARPATAPVQTTTTTDDTGPENTSDDDNSGHNDD